MTIRLKNIFTEGHFISKTFSQKDISFQEHFHRMTIHLKTFSQNDNSSQKHFYRRTFHLKNIFTEGHFISRTFSQNDILSQEQF